VLAGRLTLPAVARNRTYREVDGERIEGTWRPVFIRNGSTYFLTDLLIYADGAIWCWEWVDLDGLRQKLDSGRVATHLEPGAEASAHDLASWRFTDPQTWVFADDLLGEVADEIDRLNGRPDSTDRCLQALDRFLETRSEPDRDVLRDAYRAIPEHLKGYALGDMDAKDWPLWVLCAEPGRPLDGEEVTEEMHQAALDYFTARERDLQAARQRRSAGDPDRPDSADAPTLHLSEAVFPHGWPADPGALVLRNEYPAPIRLAAGTYPTVVHAYWALSTTDSAAHEEIRAAEQPYDAKDLAARAPRRSDWPAVRLAVMAQLLRAKYTQHPDLAAVLTATGDARIHYSGLDSSYWIAGDKDGRNWVGRLLELVRAELLAQQAGIPTAAAIG
jgi:predicted NAD-dependent protein-ADP-ribosyltransferase YbiA (DUF1768 family)